MEYPESTTVGQIWSDFRTREQDLVESWGIEYLPAFLHFEYDEGGDGIWISSAGVYTPGDRMRWNVPWHQMRLSDMSNIYPFGPGPRRDKGMRLTWGPNPETGQGLGIDWSQIPELVTLLKENALPAVAAG